jgi:hypothetical protein
MVAPCAYNLSNSRLGDVAMKYKTNLSILLLVIMGAFLGLYWSQDLPVPLSTPVLAENAVFLSDKSDNSITSQHDSQARQSLSKAIEKTPASIAEKDVDLKKQTGTETKTEILSEFKAWLTSDLKTKQQQEWVQQGLQLAQQRQPIMLRLIKTQPRFALENSLSFKEYADLPPAIQVYTEQPFSHTADLVVLPSEINQNKSSKTTPTDESKNSTYIKIATANKTHYWRVYRYGARENLLSKQGIALQGVRLGKHAAIVDTTLITVAKADYAYIRQQFKSNSSRPKKDFYTGETIAKDAEVLALAGGALYSFASYENIRHLNSQLTKLEQQNHPKSAYRILSAPLEKMAITTDSTTPIALRLARLLAIPNNWTTSIKKVLLIRVPPSDATDAAISQTDLETALTNGSSLI